jgi:hypothetical protein
MHSAYLCSYIADSLPHLLTLHHPPPPLPTSGFHDIGQYMRGEIIRGRAMFEEYLSHTPGMKSQLESYRQDTFSYATR